MSFLTGVIDVTLGPTWVSLLGRSVPVRTIVRLVTGAAASLEDPASTPRRRSSLRLRTTLILSVLHVTSCFGALVTLVAPGFGLGTPEYLALGLFLTTLGLRLIEGGTVPEDVDAEVEALVQGARTTVIGTPIRLEELAEVRRADAIARATTDRADGTWEDRIQSTKRRIQQNLETFALETGLEIEGDPPK